MIDEVMTVEQVAAMLQVSERTVAVLDLPSHKFGNNRRWLRSEVLAWLAAQPKDGEAA
jgi:excisionase family DNA binding protein